MCNGSDVASFGETLSEIKEGFSWVVADFVYGDFSLTILKASLGLQGLYECTVSFNATQIHSDNVTFSIVGKYILKFHMGFIFSKP